MGVGGRWSVVSGRWSVGGVRGSGFGSQSFLSPFGDAQGLRLGGAIHEEKPVPRIRRSQRAASRSVSESLSESNAIFLFRTRSRFRMLRYGGPSPTCACSPDRVSAAADVHFATIHHSSPVLSLSKGSSFIIHHSSFIVHRSSFIVHHSSFIIHPPLRPPLRRRPLPLPPLPS